MSTRAELCTPGWHSEVGGELQVAQAHARDWAGPVPLAQPALDAHPVIGMPSRHHDWVCHQLLQHSAGNVTRSRLCRLGVLEACTRLYKLIHPGISFPFYRWPP